MTESERLTEKRDGQNVIPLRQDGKTKWALTSAGMGNASTQFLYGTHADKLADYEAIGTAEEFKTLKEIDEDLRLQYCYEDLSNSENIGHMQGYNKAIDEFSERLKNKIELKYCRADLTSQYVGMQTCEWIDEIAEQMKGGVTDARNTV